MDKYLIDGELLRGLKNCAESLGFETYEAQAEAILDAGPIPEPLDMSDEAKFDAWIKNKQSGMEHRHGWVDCWGYLRGDK